MLSAPIAGFTDRIFRDIVREFGGCGLIYTEMVSAGGWIDGQHAAGPAATASRTRRGRSACSSGTARKRRSRRRRGGWPTSDISVIDLNFGCPKKRIMGTHAAGATLLRDPATVGRLVAAAVRGAGAVPVTAKMRLGPSIDARTAPAVARSAADNGAAAMTVHGRTADDSYGVPCNREMIAEVVRGRVACR